MKKNRNNTSIFNLILKGQKFHSSGMIDDAKRVYQSILHNSPKNFDALFLYGTLEAQCGNHKIAIDLLSQANSINPKDISCLINLANIYKELNYLDISQSLYEKAILIDLMDFKLNYDYAVLLLLIKNPSKALSHLEIAEKNNKIHIEYGL